MLEAKVGLRRGSLDLDVRLRVEPGRSVAILGPNGAGKTTLLHALAGLLPLEQGGVRLDGAVIEDVATGVRVPPERRPIGVVFQDYLLFPHLSALENVAFGPRSRGASARAARATAMTWLERVGLAAYAGARPAGLSGGQAQRVALARALAADPHLLLLDEPLSALDASARVDVRRDLRRHLDSFPGVRLLVTHDVLEAVALADRLIVLEAGRVLQEGSPAEVASRPRSKYVADLVGVNLVRGMAAGGVVTAAGGGVLAFAGPEAGDVFAVVHPRAVALFRRRPEGTPRNVWRGEIGSLDLEGDRVRVVVDGPVRLVAEVTPAAVSDLALAAGGEVWVAVKASEVSVYPA